MQLTSTVVSEICSAGTVVIAIAVEGTLVTGAVDDCQSVKALRDKVNKLFTFG